MQKCTVCIWDDAADSLKMFYGPKETGIIAPRKTGSVPTFKLNDLGKF